MHWDLLSANSPNKKSPFDEKPDTIFFTTEKIHIGFSCFLRVNVCNIPCFPKIIASRFANINSVEQFIEDRKNKNTRKKTK